MRRLCDHVRGALTRGEMRSRLFPDEVDYGGAGLISVGGRPGMGMTALALSMALEYARQADRAVVIFTYELTAEAVAERFLSMMSGIDLSRIRHRTLSDEERAHIDEARRELTSLRIYVDDTTYKGLDDMCENISTVDGVGMVVADYLGLMDRDTEASVLALKEISRIFCIPVIVTHRLSRTLELRPKNKRMPCLSDVDRAITKNVDTAILIYREAYYNPDGAADEMCASVLRHTRGALSHRRLCWCGRCTAVTACKKEAGGDVNF